MQRQPEQAILSRIRAGYVRFGTALLRLVLCTMLFLLVALLVHLHLHLATLIY